ncbi:uncharacterized protein LOC110892394 [Helianthus annuus]|uniref:uncharacterized protein LOC110892394 n=1 Tax=Helianthus annuus TaxID=4232 RepID=UPI000B906AE0|nr:uncharacterized protein LOC110892394 [Helianthus annuus]
MAGVDAAGRSGGLISMWDLYVFESNDIIKGQRFIIVHGVLKHTGELINVVNVYAFNDPAERRGLWEELVILRQSLQAELVEYQMGGRKYTYHSDNGVHKSKLDRYLVCRDFFAKWLAASVVALSNMVSDHCPILLSVLGAAALGLAVKLKWIKFKLKERVNTIKTEEELIYKENLAILENLEIQAEERLLSPNELVNRAECKKVIMEIDQAKVMDLKQRSRLKWAIEGDENSSFFHNVVNANQSSNRINGLVINGAWETNPVLIKDSICSFFAQKFQEPLPDRPGLICPCLNRISASDGELLAAPFSLLEIKEAVWECGGDKAPGPDGINFRFINRVWASLQADFIRVFEEFSGNATISAGCTSSFIALIPKCSDPDGMGDFRPISLISCINKVISKVLANRMKLVINKLISEEQTTFLANRSILDGPLILNELIPWLRSKKMEGFIFKADIEKAYDSVNWGFLESIMEQMCFLPVYTKWVMATVENARASGFETRRPVVSVLVHSRYGSIDWRDEEGIWSNHSVNNLRRILRCFYLTSGLQVNLAKSSVFGVNWSKCSRNKRLAIWKAKILSFGGRLTLIKSVLNALPTYYFSLFRAPEQVIEQLERLRREFLWGLTPEKGKTVLVAWDNVMTPKDLGGVGVGSLKDANLAMLAKWWWRFKTDPDSLWRKVIWGIHNSERSWNPIPRKMTIAGPWKQIFKVSKDMEKYGIVLSECFRVSPGVGDTVSFWKDKWTGDGTLLSRYPGLYQLEKVKNAAVSD